MRMLDLFSGIGGFALAAEWVWGDELDITGFCEIEEYAQKVLQKNFPGVPIHDDITKLNGKDFKNIDLITGGFPCQDISVAGKGAGIKEGTRSGLWFELWRIISEIRPRFALIENVPMLTIRGGTRVIADLAKIGYDCEWQVISAKQVGSWHKRERMWIITYSNKNEYTFNRKSRSRRKSRKLCRSNLRDLWDKNIPSDFVRISNGIPSRVDRLKGLGNSIVPQVAALIMERIKNETKTGR